MKKFVDQELLIINTFILLFDSQIKKLSIFNCSDDLGKAQILVLEVHWTESVSWSLSIRSCLSLIDHEDVMFRVFPGSAVVYTVSSLLGLDPCILAVLSHCIVEWCLNTLFGNQTLS